MPLQLSKLIVLRQFWKCIYLKSVLDASNKKNEYKFPKINQIQSELACIFFDVGKV